MNSLSFSFQVQQIMNSTVRKKLRKKRNFSFNLPSSECNFLMLQNLMDFKKIFYPLAMCSIIPQVQN